MHDHTHAPGPPLGALIGALLTAPLVAVFWLAARAAGLPFVPFDVFDWLARVLPGSVVTFGIDTMVGVIRLVGIRDIADAAKTGEQALGVAGTIVIGALVGAVLFAALRRARREIAAPPATPVGLAVGAVLGVATLLISGSVNETATADPVLGAAWIVLAFSVWGLLLGRSWARLAPPPRAPARAPATVSAVDRRRFLVTLGGASAAITVVGVGVASRLGTGRRSPRSGAVPWSDTHRLPNAGAAVKPVSGTRPEFTPVRDHYRVDINARPPVVDEADWRLRVTGLVERPAAWTIEELRTGFAHRDQFITLACISNPIAGSLIGTQRWTGVPLRDVLAHVRPHAAATHLQIRSADGFHEVVAVADVMRDARIMLTWAWDGLPLPAGHGYPLRIYIPDRYGMKQPKWIESIEAVATPEDGYWVQRGWDREARMRATSVIDTVGVDLKVTDANGRTLIPIGGIAHAGARGISRVEVRADDGPWEPAELRTPISETTWVLWRYDWAFSPGAHRLTVRCFEGDGTPQIEERTGVRPDGATGLDSERVTV